MKHDIDPEFLRVKLIFLVKRLEYIKKYYSSTIEDLFKDFEKIKFIEKVIQEIVDCSVDINQYLAENLLNKEIRSNKDSFWKIQKILQKEDEYIKRLIDTVSFRNEIVHSYDAGIKIVWKSRNVGYFIDIYKDYVKDMDRVVENLTREDQEVT